MVGRGAATEVELERAAAADTLAHEFDLAPQLLEVRTADPIVIGADHDVAGAIQAPLLAEGEVHVEHDGVIGLADALEALGVVVRTELVGELDRGRVRGVARTRSVVSAQ